MNKTFSTMITNVGSEVQDTSSTFQTIIKRYINRRYFQVLKSINWDRIFPDYTLSLTAGTATYALPEDFGKPVIVRDSTNDVELSEISLQKMIQDNPSLIDVSGAVTSYAIYDDVVKAQPSSASALAITSSSSADTTQTIRVRGISSGAEVTENLTLTGTTPVNSSNQYTRVLGLSLSAVTTGKITVTSNSAAVTLAVLSPSVTTAYYKIIRFFQAPIKAITVSIPYYVSPLPMVNNEDYPTFDCSDLIELGAIADAWRYKRQFNKASVFESQFQSALADLIWNKENKPNEVFSFQPATFDKDNLY